MAHEEWICLSRPTILDGVVVAWRPSSWPEDDRGYAVSVSRKGVIVGEVYLHEIPEWVLTNAHRAWQRLNDDDAESVLAMVTHQRVRRGAKWYLEPVHKEVLVND